MLDKGGQLKLPEPRNPEDVGKTDDPRYCLYYRALGHPTKSCWSLKDKLQALVDAGALRLKIEQKTATANMTSCIQFGQSPPDSHRSVPHPCGRNEGHQLRPPSPTREGSCSHNHPWGW